MPAAPAAPAASAARPVTPRAKGIEVLLPDGSRLPAGVTLLGRAPSPRADDDASRCIELPDRTVTKTHLELRLAEASLWVVDRASTNGTLVEDAAGTLRRCPPWLPTPVPVPGSIHLGHTRLRVLPVELPAAAMPETAQVAS